jgi:hypothetical protein
MNTGVIFEGGVIPKNRGDGGAPDSSYFDLKPNTPLTSMILCFSLAFVSVWNQRPIFFFPPHYVTRNLLAEQTLGLTKVFKVALLIVVFP